MKKSKNQTQKQIQKKIRRSEFFQKFYFLIPYLSLLSTLWSSVVLVCVPGLFIKNDRLTWYSIVITLVFLVPNAILVFIKDHYEQEFKNNTDVVLYKKAEALYRELIRAFLNIVTNKNRRLTKAISTSENHFYADPSEQIADIFSEMRKCLSFLLTNKKNRIEEDDIYINLLYNIDNSSDWLMLEPNQKGLSYDKLMNDKSFFKFLLDNNSNYLFYNNKQDLLNIDRYIQDERDVKENNQLKGSILGYKFDAIKIPNHSINVLLFISTFSTRFVEPKNDEDDITVACDTVKENIKKTILAQFVPRIQIELCHEYIIKRLPKNITPDESTESDKNESY